MFRFAGGMLFLLVCALGRPAAEEAAEPSVAFASALVRKTSDYGLRYDSIPGR